MYRDNEKKNFFFSKLFLLGIFLALGLVGFAYGRAYYQDYLVRAEISRLQSEVRNLETKKLESLELFKYVQSTAFAEEKARTDLNMAKPSEKMAIIVRGAKAGQSNGQAEEKVLEWDNNSNIIKWWKFFFEGVRSAE